jgi:tetratricopeptide (TPR) repeat protein
MEDQATRLDALEQQLLSAVASPPPDLPAFLDDWLRELRSVPFSVDPVRRIRLLIDVAGQYYLHGQKVFNAVEPIALAIMLAEQNGETAHLRRALSIQGLVLNATRNTPDALRSLMQALDIAEGSGDNVGVAAVWGNIAVTLLDATLYTDARVSYERADAMAAAIEGEGAESRYGAGRCTA